MSDESEQWIKRFPPKSQEILDESVKDRSKKKIDRPFTSEVLDPLLKNRPGIYLDKEKGLKEQEEQTQNILKMLWDLTDQFYTDRNGVKASHQPTIHFQIPTQDLVDIGMISPATSDKIRAQEDIIRHNKKYKAPSGNTGQNLVNPDKKFVNSVTISRLDGNTEKPTGTLIFDENYLRLVGKGADSYGKPIYREEIVRESIVIKNDNGRFIVEKYKGGKQNRLFADNEHWVLEKDKPHTVLERDNEIGPQDINKTTAMLLIGMGAPLNLIKPDQSNTNTEPFS